MLKRIGVPPPLEKLLADQDRISPIWIVGGAIRDQFLQRSTHDVDFTTSGDAIGLARMAADRLNADIYILDAERGAARVLFRVSDRERRTFDFARLRGDTIETDLRARDFTINAMGLRLSVQEQIVDPCGGLRHVREGVLELCAEDAIEQDPVRALRAVRIATDLGFRLSAQTRKKIRENRDLASISSERIRDEIFCMLALGDPTPAFQSLDYLGVMQQVLPPSHSHLFKRERIQIVAQSIDRAFRSLRHLVSILECLAPAPDLDAAAQATLGLLTWTLGRYRTPLDPYLFEEISFNRRCRELLLMLHFLHGLVQNPDLQRNANGLHLPMGDELRIYEEIGDHLRLSRDEILWGQRWINGIRMIDSQVDQPASVDLFSHRFYRGSQTSGVGATLSFLAFELSKQVEPPAADQWASRVELARHLLEAWFEKYETIVEPQELIRGEDVLQVLNAQSGPEIGQLLEQVREGQVMGELVTRDQALEFIKRQGRA